MYLFKNIKINSKILYYKLKSYKNRNTQTYFLKVALKLSLSFKCFHIQLYGCAIMNYLALEGTHRFAAQCIASLIVQLLLLLLCASEMVK